MAMTALAVGAALGLAKSQLVDKPAEQRQAMQAAVTQNWSPWTGIKAQPVKYADPFASAMTGAAQGQNLYNNSKPGATGNTWSWPNTSAPDGSSGQMVGVNYDLSQLGK